MLDERLFVALALRARVRWNLSAKAILHDDLAFARLRVFLRRWSGLKNAHPDVDVRTAVLGAAIGIERRRVAQGHDDLAREFAALKQTIGHRKLMLDDLTGRDINAVPGCECRWTARQYAVK